MLGLSLCWDHNWPRLYDPATDTYLESWQEVAAAREAAREAARAGAEARAAIEQAAREAAEARIRQLEAEELRRRQADR